MQFGIDGNNLVINHKDSELTFAFKYYLKGNSKLTEKIYDPINRYIASLPETKQDEIFKRYFKIHTIFYKDNLEIRYPDEVITDVVSILQVSVAELYSKIDFEHLAEWCVKEGDFYLQNNLKDDYGLYKEETTYLREDYKRLLYLSTLLKLVTPIWGVFLTEFDKAVGKDYKETAALSLLSKTDILNLPEFEKLEKLVVNLSDKTVITINAVFGNLGTVDLPDWALAIVTVRKIAVAEVNNPEVKLINIIYSHLTNLNKKNSLEDRGDSVRIRERKSPEEDSSGDEENRASVLEKYKLRQAHPDHVSIIDEVYLKKMKKVLKDIDPTFPLNDEIYKKALNDFNTSSLRTLDITDFHLQICGLACRRVISPWNLGKIHFNTMIRVIYVTQLLLHYWGFKTVANLLTAQTVDTPDDVLKDNSYVSLSVELQEEIAKLYPYFKNSNKTMAINRKPWIVNYGMMFINSTVDFINKHSWYYVNDNLSDKKECVGLLIEIPVNMKIELAEMLIKTMIMYKDVKI